MVKFLRLPYLVKDLVFKEMELKEILLLSFCSKRVQKSIKQQFRIEFNKGFRITCGMNDPRMCHWQDEDEKRLELIVDHKENDKKVISWKYVNSLENLDLLNEFKFLEEKYSYEACDIDLKPGFTFEINGLRCRCSISLDLKSGIPTLYFEKNVMKKWPMELHKYCVELFRTTSDLEMIMNLNDSSDLHENQTIKDSYLHNSLENLDPRIVDEFFEKANIQNSFSTVMQRLEGFVSDDSKLWNIPNVFIPNSWVHARQLIRFTGKHANFSVGDYRDDVTQDLNAFLKHWLNSDNTNLETLVVRGSCSSTEGLFDGIQTSRWDPAKRQAKYVSNVPFETLWEYRFGEGCRFSNYLSFWPNELDCTDTFDIVRQSDGLIASIKVDISAFSREICLCFYWNI
ncbi:hypothetical protein B9Z55_002410 [Caenorhabditis nigoni]|uniref:Uncharacterized protein n=3 Tax=Caenorhabditis nigoni TaxID=1611254 RepID=A0A2G5VKE1_9PELO|nr:hypothetical protein B9Z55_002410 [Caenorhabditis nigoni]